MRKNLIGLLAALWLASVVPSRDGVGGFDPLRFEALPPVYDFSLKNGDFVRTDTHCHFGAPCPTWLDGRVLNAGIKGPVAGESYRRCHGDIELHSGQTMKRALNLLGEPDRVFHMDGSTYMDYRPGLRVQAQEGKLRSFTVFPEDLADHLVLYKP